MKVVVSGFPGVGKSTITKNAAKYGLKVCGVQFNEATQEYERIVPTGPEIPVYDSDSSVFDKENFPANYIKHIKEVLNNHDNGVVIFISSHDNVREALQEAGIEYQLVYPARELKEEFLERYKNRGSGEFFLNMMAEKWDQFIDSVEKDPAEKRFVLQSGQNLADVIGPQITELVGEQSPTPPSVEGNEDMEPSRAELVEAHYDMQADAEILEDVITKIKSDDCPPVLVDDGEMLVAAADDVKARYGVEVAPTLAGMESFLDTLKAGMSKLMGKKQVERKERIKDLYDLKKHLEELKPKDDITLVDGDVTLNISKSLVGKTTLEAVDKIVTEAGEDVKAPYKKQHDNTKARLVAGLKVFNKFAKHKVIPVEEASSVIGKDFPIKPEAIVVDYNYPKEPNDVPVKVKALDKEGVDKAVEILSKILSAFLKMEEGLDNLSKDSLDYAEMARSPFWDGIWDAEEVTELADAIYYQRVTYGLNEVIWNWEAKVLPTIKFLESWILKSVK